MRILYIFSLARFYPIGFTSKVVMRHILNSDHSRGSVVNEESLCNVVNDHIHI